MPVLYSVLNFRLVTPTFLSYVLKLNVEVSRANVAQIRHFIKRWWWCSSPPDKQLRGGKSLKLNTHIWSFIRWRMITLFKCSFSLLQTSFITAMIIRELRSFFYYLFIYLFFGTVLCPPLLFKKKGHRHSFLILAKCSCQIFLSIFNCLEMHLYIPRDQSLKWEEYGPCVNLPPSGRPLKMRGRASRRLVRAATKTPSKTLKESQAPVVWMGETVDIATQSFMAEWEWESYC